MIQNLVSLRFIFIFLIYLSHISYMGFPEFDFGGECGVSFFFVLSGFVLSLRYGESIVSGEFRHRHFMVHQIAKFYPLHLLILAITIGLNFKNLDGHYLLMMLPTVVLCQSWLLRPEFYFAGNAVSWFLCDIIFLYLLFPYIYKVVAKRKYALMALALTVYFAYVACVPKEKYNDFVYLFPPSRIIDFSLGIVSYKLYLHIESRVDTSTKAYGLELLAIAILAATCWLYPMVDPRLHCAALLWPMSIACVVAFAASDKHHTWLTTALHNPIIMMCGTVSFEFFLLHPIINWNAFVLLNKVGLSHMPMIELAVCLGVVIFFSWLTNRYFTRRAATIFSKIVKI